MAEASEAPVNPEVAKVQAMLAELDAGDTEVSQSEPISSPPEPTDIRDDGQPGEAEASSENTDEPEAPANEDADTPEEPAGTLDLEWIDKQDSAYADFLTTLHEEGKLDEDTFKSVKQAYQPRRGMNAAQQRAAEAEAAAQKWEETGKPLFESDDARRDFLEWRDSRERGEPKANPLDGMKDRLKTVLSEGDDEDFASTILDVVKQVTQHQQTATRQQDAAAAREIETYNDSLIDWASAVKQEFIDVEGATPEDVTAASKALEATFNRRGHNAMDIVRSQEDLRAEMAPFVEKAVTQRKFDELLGRQSDRSKQYNGKSLKASSSPAISPKVEEDLTTFSGRTRALQNDPEIQDLMKGLSDIF